MKIFKASFVLLGIVFSIAACKPKQSVAGQPKTETAVASAEKTVVAQAVASKKDTAYSIFAVDRARKTVYRGMKNPLTIVVPNAVSVKAEGNGLMKVDDFGHYDIRPGMGTTAEIKISAVMRDGSAYSDLRVLNIRNVPNPLVYLTENTKSGILTEEQLKKTEVGMLMSDFDYDLVWTVTGFDVLYPNGKKIKVKGNKFDAKALEMLKKVRHNASITITNVAGESNPQTTILFHPEPITVKVNKKARPKK